MESFVQIGILNMLDLNSKTVTEFDSFVGEIGYERSYKDKIVETPWADTEL